MKFIIIIIIIGILIIVSVIIAVFFLNILFTLQAFRKISGYLDYAKSCPDIELIAGGNADDSRGYFIEPTILLTKNPTDKVMKVCFIAYLIPQTYVAR